GYPPSQVAHHAHTNRYVGNGSKAVTYDSMMTPTIRFAVVPDAPAVLAFWQEAAESPHTDDERSIGQVIEHDPEALIVAESEGVGSVIAAWDGWRGSIYRLAVTPDHRCGGLGRRLVSEAEQRLAEAGALRLHAHRRRVQHSSHQVLASHRVGTANRARTLSA